MLMVTNNANHRVTRFTYVQDNEPLALIYAKYFSKLDPEVKVFI